MQARLSLNIFRLRNRPQTVSPLGPMAFAKFCSLLGVDASEMIVKFHIEMFRPFVEFRVARKSNGGLVVSHDVGDRNPEFHKRTKHFNVKFHYQRAVLNAEIELQYI
jgi:hypothetical protein